MKKPTKMAIVFGAAIAAVLIVGVIMVIMLPKKIAPEPTTTTPSATATATTASPSGTASATPTPSVSDGSITQEKTADGAIYHITVPGDVVTYSVAVKADEFKFTGKADSVTFTSISDGDDYIQITYNKGTEAAQLAPGIMDRYIKYNEFEQSGQNDIPGTEIAGETVSASDGSSSMIAWLVDTDGGVLAVVIHYNITDTKADIQPLYNVLKTIKIAQ